MKSLYGKHNPKAGVLNYELLDDAIIVEFADHKSRYLYNAEAPGSQHVEAMKHLAIAGKGLTTYINQNVREHYAAKLPANSQRAVKYKESS